MADITTEAFEWFRRGTTLSRIVTASLSELGVNAMRVSSRETWFHWVHSLRAARIFVAVGILISSTEKGALCLTSFSAAAALAMTCGFASSSSPVTSASKLPDSTTSGLRSKTLATESAAVLRTKGSASCRPTRTGSTMPCAMFSTRTLVRVRRAIARKRGFGSETSRTILLKAIVTASPLVAARAEKNRYVAFLSSTSLLSRQCITSGRRTLTLGTPPHPARLACSAIFFSAFFVRFGS
mmetsp:Transcript_7616/g.27640  ORF Transcript_7616/g.27640 Transcript_7616/m.27640 type:complete len:240 (+) Transcript_7616:1784-2503(+)